MSLPKMYFDNWGLRTGQCPAPTNRSAVTDRRGRRSLQNGRRRIQQDLLLWGERRERRRWRIKRPERVAAVGERRRRSRQGEHRVPQQERCHDKVVTDEVRSKLRLPNNMQTPRHCEPARTLAWQSVPPAFSSRRRCHDKVVTDEVFCIPHLRSKFITLNS